jgi:hypothetical protein
MYGQFLNNFQNYILKQNFRENQPGNKRAGKDSPVRIKHSPGAVKVINSPL